jgi:hypothetical protein
VFSNSAEDLERQRFVPLKVLLQALNEPAPRVLSTYSLGLMAGAAVDV